jgi:hypothetical protein
MLEAERLCQLAARAQLEPGVIGCHDHIDQRHRCHNDIGSTEREAVQQFDAFGLAGGGVQPHRQAVDAEFAQREARDLVNVRFVVHQDNVKLSVMHRRDSCTSSGRRR